MLKPVIKEERAKELITRMGTTLGSITGMLNSLLDINRIDAGIIPSEQMNFAISDLIKRLGDEFKYHAEAKGLELRVVHCERHIFSDPPLLEQILRNLLANAIKFTKQGKVLFGCRFHENMLRIEVWDTGVGIAQEEIKEIFNEYHQLTPPSFHTDGGLGLGLAIVERLARLMGHRINVESHLGRGTVFSIEVELAGGKTDPSHAALVKQDEIQEGGFVTSSYNVLLIENDLDLLDLLKNALSALGHKVMTASNSETLTRILSTATSSPDIIIADFNLADRSNGLQLAVRFRVKFKYDVPIIILTGDISTSTIKRIKQENCVHIHKPISVNELEKVMRDLINKAKAIPTSDKTPPRVDQVTINVIDDDAVMREKLSGELEQDGRIVKSYATSESFLEDYLPGGTQCLILDAYLPGLSGLNLLHHMAKIGTRLPTIMITGLSDTQIAVEAMKAGAVDFIEKPFKLKVLKKSLAKALEQSAGGALHNTYLENISNRYKNLTPRQIEVMDLVLAGHPNKNIATTLGISQRTVENHRAAVMKKTDSVSLPALALFAVGLSEIKGDKPATS